MKRGRNAYRRYTEGVNQRKVELKNGRYTAVRFNSMNGERKWTLENRDVPLFRHIGTIPDVDNIIVGEENGGLYMIRTEPNPVPLCRFKSYESYQCNKFIWVVGGGGSEVSQINTSGRYLIHIPTGRYCECQNAPKMVSFGSKFRLDKKIIEWSSDGFTISKEDTEEESVEDDKDIIDMRNEELESYLSENVKLEIISNSDNMTEVNRSETPKPIAEMFYEMGEGDYPEDPEGSFEPPSQDEFAVSLYYKFKELSDTNDFREETKESWMRRFKNAWASLVRDVHFSFMMQKEQKETQCFEQAEFDMKKDIEEGIDFIARSNDVEYHINLFIDSSNSRKFLNKKKKYRHPENNAVAVEVPMKFWGDKKKSIDTEGEELWMYSEEHIDAVKRIVLDDDDKVEKDGITLAKKIGNLENG